MSTYPALYNGELPTVFNPNDFYTTEYIQSLETTLLNGGTVTSTSLVSNAIAVLNTDGSTSNTATEPWVTTQINNAVQTLSGTGTLQSTLATLQQIDQAINNDPNFYTDITASIATVQTNVNTNSSAITVLQNRATTDESNITNLQNNKLNANNGNSTGTLYAQNINLSGVLTTGNISANGVTVTPAQISYLGNVTSDIQNQINSKASTSSPVFTGTLTSASIVDNGTFTANNNVILGTNTTNTTTINSTIVANSKNVSPTQIGYLSNVSSDLQSQLNSKASTSSPIFTGTLTSASIVDNGSLTCNNGLTVSSGTISFPSNSISQTAINGLATSLSSKQNTLVFDSVPTSGSSNVLTSGAVYTADTNLQSQITTNTSNISTNTSSISSINTTLAGKQNTLTFDSSPTASSTNPVTSGGIYSALQNYETTSALTTTLGNYLTTSNASSTYQPISSMSSYATTSSLSSYAPINNASLTGITTVNEISEQVYNSGSGTNLSLTYTSIRGIIYYSPSANFTLTLTSVPTSSTTESYSLTFIYNTKYYCNAISVNGTSYTMIAGGGLSNISINSSATYIMQQVSIMYLNSSTPIVVTNVLSLF